VCRIPKAENLVLHPKVKGINGCKMYETWFQMEALPASGKLNLEPVITHRLKLAEFPKAMEYLRTGEAINVVFKLEQGRNEMCSTTLYSNCNCPGTDIRG